MKRTDLKYLKKSNSTTKYLTGIASYDVLVSIFKFIEPYLITSLLLTKEQMFMLTLKRLRLNDQLHSLALEYSISQTSASKYFHPTLFVLYTMLKGLIKWPERSALKNHMPSSFTSIYKNRVTVVIDCFEIFMERPSTMLASCNVFSHYKNHNTIKILIGISPNGSIIFLSEPYGGRCTDKFVTEDCGFLNCLNDEDFVIADKGFNLNDSTVNKKLIAMPTFKKANNQLTPVELDYSCKLSSVY